jgi:glucan phosphoethanolaminetransferase (alkaline phosphatase superfamily)
MEEIIGHFPTFITIFTGKIHLRVPSFPVIQLNEQIFMFMSLLIIVILFVFIAFVFVESKWSKLLAIIVGVIEIINGGYHIVASLYFVKYIPGSISAVGLVIFGFLVIFSNPSIRRDEAEQT